MNLNLLRVFATVVEHKSFSTAAKTLYISQPAVSKNIQEFEEQLGMVLIDRSRRTMTLTEAGVILYEHAQRLFAIERAAEKNLEALYGLERGYLAIGASHTIGTYLLPYLLGLFHERYPGIKLSLVIKNTRDVVEDLRTTPLDMVFVEGPAEGADLNVIPWKRDRLLIIASPQHPLAHQSHSSIDDISRVPYVQRESGSGTRETVEQIFQKTGAHLNVALELGSNQAVKQAVIAGLGISMVSEATIELEQKVGVLTVIESSDFEFHRTLSYITVRDRPQSRALMAFRELLTVPLLNTQPVDNP